MKAKNIPVNSILFFLIISLALGIFLIHRKLEKAPPLPNSLETYMCIPSGEFLKPFTLGFDQLIADYFWIKTVGYFGEHLMSDRNYPWLYHLLDLITTLDPQFIWPYYFGGIILSLEAKQVEQSNRILEKACQYHPEVWKFPFFLGFNYWYHYNDPLTAAYYIKIAAQLPKSPAFLKTFPARLLTEAGQKEAAIRFLMEMRNTTQDSQMKHQIEKRIEEIIQGKNLKLPQLRPGTNG